MYQFTITQLMVCFMVLFFVAWMGGAIVHHMTFNGRLTDCQFDIVEEAYQQVLSDLEAATEPAEIRRLQKLAVMLEAVPEKNRRCFRKASEPDEQQPVDD